MELTVFERLLLRNIVPQIQGWNFGHMKEARHLLEDMFTPEEEEKLQIKTGEDGKSVIWRVRDSDKCQKHNQSIWNPEWIVKLVEDKAWLPDVDCTCVPIPQEKEIPVREGLQKKIAKFLEQLDRENRLGFEHYTLCEKFGIEKPAQ